ncbi:hypothetical protein SAMN06272737_1579 [Blastococcus mobilis]|uniref:Uncharacterized protein n=1 Tax=Blastococcus mobilis TaxID=1938746 RepID=A0A239ATL3_9ACTN|nr:hypothetical protein SAMN06272737_1579 [Blastococcus mobilis]
MANSGCGTVVGGLLILGVIGSIFNGCDDDDSGSSGSDGSDSGAYYACEGFVEDRLKAPSSADFSGYFDSYVIQSGDEYTVSGYVDAENSFGAMLRSEWTCTVRDGGDTWYLESLTGLD